MKTFTLSLFALALSASVAQAQQLTPTQDQALQELNTLLKEHPQIIESVNASLKNYVETQRAQLEARTAHHDWLYNNPAHPVLGDPTAEHKIVVFTDYNCPYCKKLDPELTELLEDYPNLQVVNVFVPIRQEKVSGLDTSSALYAINLWQQKPEHFLSVHELLTAKSGMHTAKSLQQIARKTKTQDYLMAQPNSEDVVQQNVEAFRALGYRGTPTIMIGNQVIPGFVKAGQLKDVIEQELNL